MKKSFLLVILFLIPVALILFLKFFGVSHFNVQVYYQDEKPSASCGDVNLPYSVNGDLPGIKSKKNLLVYSFLNTNQNKALFVSELIRLKDKFHDTDEIAFVLLVDSSKVEDIDPTGELNISGSEWEVHRLNKAIFSDIYTCDFFLPHTTEEGDTANTVLLDDGKRIRGYYDLYTREETDRLSGEIKILTREKDLSE